MKKYIDLIKSDKFIEVNEEMSSEHLKLLKDGVNFNHPDFSSTYGKSVFHLLTKDSVFPRFLRSKENRNLKRNKKQAHVLSRTFDLDFGVDLYEKDFCLYERKNKDPFFSNQGIDLNKIENAFCKKTKMPETFISSSNLSKIIRDYKNKKEYSYDFVRCSIKTAAVILSKMEGFAPSQNANQVTFYLNKKWKFRDRMIFNKEVDNPTYLPVVLPSNMIKNKEVDEIIEICDNYPELGGNPLFDFFWIVVPFVEFRIEVNSSNEAMCILDGEKFCCKTYEELIIKISSMLVNETNFVLLGERDKKNYFIAQNFA